jgi:hypothetical protein
MGKKKDKKKKEVDVTIQNREVVYGDTAPNSKERKAAIQHMLRNYTGGRAVKRYVNGKMPELNENVIVEYLIAEEFATSESSAILIMQHMSDEWLEHILSESKRGEAYAKALQKLRKSIESGEEESRAKVEPTPENKYIPTKRVTQLSKVAIR